MARPALIAHARPAAMILTMAGAELLWLYALLNAVNEWLRLGAFVPALCAAYVVSCAFSLAMRALRRSAFTTAVISWLLWALATSLSIVTMQGGFSGIRNGIKESVFVVLASGVLWWSGARLANDRLSYESVVTRFQFGMAMLAVSLLLGYLAKVDQTTSVPIALAFVALGLAAAALARTDEERPARRSSRGGTWWGMLLVSVAVILGLGLIVGVLLTPDVIDMIGRGVHSLWDVVERALRAIGDLFPTSCADDPNETLSPTGPALPGQGKSGPFISAPSWLRSLSGVLSMILILGLALAAVWSVASRVLQRIRRGGEDGAQMESLHGAFGADLARMLRRIVHWLGSWLDFSRLDRDRQGELAPITSVRRIYADMLRWGAAAGHPRESSQTPFEYRQTLCAARPAHETEVALITESYMKARYGAIAPTPAELHVLAESRNRLRRGRS